MSPTPSFGMDFLLVFPNNQVIQIVTFLVFFPKNGEETIFDVTDTSQVYILWLVITVEKYQNPLVNISYHRMQM